MISCEEFVKRLSDSQILARDDLRAALDEIGDAAGVVDARALTNRLIETSRLTSFQAEAILDGRLSRLLIGNYSILSPLGTGGMGTVYKARHRRMNRVVAIKILSRDNSGQSDRPERFQREVETIAQLNHPNIVAAHDAGEADDCLYLVMEYVDGRDLGSEVALKGPLPVADAVDCVIQAARGLACAHDRGIVHRDVKPANLLRDTAGVVKLADLGLAYLGNSDASTANASLTLAGSILGTADYIAPEQALDSADVDHRVDIYGLGGTLFFLLTGRPMYAARSLAALLLKHRDAPIPSLDRAGHDIPAELEEIYRRMVAKRPEDRFATMAEVVCNLERLKGAVALSHEQAVPGDLSQPGVSPTALTVAANPSRVADSNEDWMKDTLSVSEQAPTPSLVSRVSDLTVILVEPSGFQARIARKYLLELHIENVLSARTGGEAIELARREGAHVVLSSMHLPDMNGVQLAQALREDPRCSRLGFVLASSDCERVEVKKALDAPRIAILPKPLELRRLAQSLAVATGRVLEEIER
jgi:serine/threonine-protein kinase